MRVKFEPLRAELLSRVVLTLAAACFAAGLNIEHCLVQVDPLFEDERPEERHPVWHLRVHALGIYGQVA